MPRSPTHRLPLSPVSPSLSRQGSRSLHSFGDSRAVSPTGIQLQGDFIGNLNASLNANLGNSLRSTLGKQSLSRSRTEGFLYGVSSSAEFLNSKQDQNLLVLVHGSTRGKYSFSPSHADTLSQPPGWRGAELDEQDFVRSTDRLVNSISDLRNRHEAFEAMGSPMTRRRRSSTMGGGGYMTKDTSEGASHEEQEKAERLAERLEAYKMVRKVEGEIPQLPPLSSLPPIKKDPLDETIIKRNASSNVIQLSSPSKRKEMIHTRSEVLGHRTVLAQQSRDEAITQLKSHFTETIQRKRMQGERVTTARTDVVKKASQPTVSLPEQWLKICVLASSMKHLQEEVKVGRMPPDERLQFMQEHPSTTKSHNPFVAQAIFLSEIMSDEKKCWKLQLLAAMVRAKLAIIQKRKETGVIFECLLSWQVAGRCFKAFKALADRVVMLQRWWRKTSRNLRDIRDQISRRWERIERAQLVQELNRATPLPPRPNKSTTQPKLTLEDKIEMERVEESFRLRFIENELRVRRYKMLPQIQMWEEEVAKWRSLHQEWQETKDAHRALGKEAPAMRIFHWPPVRPSYLPKAHPLVEARGAACCEQCPGRQGDEEILCMWRAARRNPGLDCLTPMPQKGGGACADLLQPAGKRGSPKRGHPSRANTLRVTIAEGGGREAAVNPFGDAADEELRQWGVSAEGMPGLSGDGEGEASGERTAALVCSPC